MIDVIWGALVGAWPTFLLFLTSVGIAAWLSSERPSWHSLGAIAAFAAAIVLMSLYDAWEIQTDEDLHFAYEVWATGNHASALVYAILAAAFVYDPPKRGDFLLAGIVAVIVFAEGWTAFMENLNCNFLQADIPYELQTEAERNMSKCERIYGFWYRYVPIVLELAIMLYFISRYQWAARVVKKAAQQVRKT